MCGPSSPVPYPPWGNASPLIVGFACSGARAARDRCPEGGASAKSAPRGRGRGGMHLESRSRTGPPADPAGDRGFRPRPLAPRARGRQGQGPPGHYRANVHSHHQGKHGKGHGNRAGHHGRHGHHGHGHHGHGQGKRELSVMTRNLYLGSSLTPALAAETPEEFVEAVALIYGTVQFTDFPARSEAIADEIQATEPDLIGLQEVTKWTTAGLSPPPGYDFLEILEGSLEARGLHYSVAAVANNANIGPAPLVS